MSTMATPTEIAADRRMGFRCPSVHSTPPLTAKEPNLGHRCAI
jgi:hypothetical protein